MEFYTLLTDSGKNKIAQCFVSRTPLELSHFAVGDGGDGYYEPDAEQTELVNEMYRSNIARIAIDKNYANRFTVECSIPSTSGGYHIREIGIYDTQGTLFAIGRIPESYKPIESEGSTRDFYIKVVVEVDNERDMELIADSNVSIISYEYFENDHNLNPEAHFRLLDADKTDGYHAGNKENQLAVSNGELCKNLNADKLDGRHAGNNAGEVLVLDESALVPDKNLKPYAAKSHTHPVNEILTSESLHSFDNMHIESGANIGTTTYVYPPSGYTMSDLLAFIPSIRTIHFAGDVNGDDSLYCYWSAESTRIAVICYNTEQRANPQVNWLAIWRKNRPIK